MSVLTFEHSLRVLLRRRRVVAGVVVAITATALSMALFRPAVYTASAEVVIQPATADPLATTRLPPRVDPLRDIQTEAELIGSSTIRGAVAAMLKVTNPPPVSAVPLIDADGVSLTVRSGDPRQAARFANAYADAYLRFKESNVHQAFLAAAQALEARIAELQRQIDDDAAKVASNPRSSAGSLAARDALIVQVGLVKELLDQTQLRAGVAGAGAFLAAPATTPSKPTSPKVSRYGILGVAFGLFIGVGLAFLVESLDGSVRSREDIGLVAPDVSTLGIIPLTPEPGTAGHSRSGFRRRSSGEGIEAAFVVIDSPDSPAAEGFRGLRTSIEFLALDRSLGLVLVSSPGRGDGKTSTIVNVAMLLASAGRRVCVVSTDERGAAETLLSRPPGAGLADVVFGDIPLSSAVQAVPQVDNLFVLPAGPFRVDRSAFLTQPRTGGVLAGLRSGFDLVLVDAPPVLAGGDAVALLPWVDCVVLVVRVGRTTRADLARALEWLDRAAACVLGVVVNAVTASDRGGTTSYGSPVDTRTGQPPPPTATAPRTPGRPERAAGTGRSSVSVRAPG